GPLWRERTAASCSSIAMGGTSPTSATGNSPATLPGAPFTCRNESRVGACRSPLRSRRGQGLAVPLHVCRAGLQVVGSQDPGKIPATGQARLVVTRTQLDRRPNRQVEGHHVGSGNDHVGSLRGCVLG